MMTPSDHMSHDLSYFSGPRTSGASNTARHASLSVAADRLTVTNSSMV